MGGANGANRLSGNAITEALVFGRRAGRSAAVRAKAMRTAPALNGEARPAVDLLTTDGPSDLNTAELIANLQQTMADDVGPFRDATRLARAVVKIDELARTIGERPAGTRQPFDMQRVDWLDLRNMVLVARSVVQSALARDESRGAHQREDHEVTRPEWQVNQLVRLRGGDVTLEKRPVAGGHA